MKAISLLQPWASLVIMGAKEWETRSWATRHRGPLLIHASAKKPTRREKAMFENDPNFRPFIPQMEELPYGAIIGKTILKEIFTTGYLVQHLEDFKGYNWKNEFAFDDLSPNRYAWQFVETNPLKHFLPMKGSLGIWEYNGIL
ncbi:MAG: ASCH domain-containing protein [Chitinophagaceae bacterium]